MSLYPVILSGGSGKRLWPLSRPSCPKQFLSLCSRKTMLQETVLRLDSLDAHLSIIIGNQKHRHIIAKNLCKISKKAGQVILEPISRNTAPAVAVCALNAYKENDAATLLVLPSDHVIEDIESYKKSVSLATQFAYKGHMVTFGIKPTHAHTGYGYLEIGDTINSSYGEACKLAEYKEKPDLRTAKKFLKSGNHLWNSGIFCFQAKTYLEELERHCPKIIKHAQDALNNAVSTEGGLLLNEDDFAQCPNTSIDYTVMEHTKRGVIIPLDAGWSDIGSWGTLLKIRKKIMLQHIRSS